MNFIRRVLRAIGQFLLPRLLRSEAWLPMAVVAINALLVIALAHTLAGLTLAILTGKPISLADGVLAPASKFAVDEEQAARQPADVAAIGAWHLFGKVEAKRPIEAPPIAVPATPLNLRLVGLFFAERGVGPALALIADGDQLERSYQIGDSLPGGARLKRIEHDQVVVFRNGREESLKLPKLDDPNRPVVAPEPLLVTSAPAEQGPATFHSPQVIDASAIAGRLRSEALNRPQALEDIALARPYVQNGQFVGFRLQPGRDRRIFQQLGLNGGDILTEINGTRLSSPTQGLALLQELIDASQIDVRLLRNGVEIPLTFTLDGS